MHCRHTLVKMSSLNSIWALCQTLKAINHEKKANIPIKNYIDIVSKNTMDEKCGKIEILKIIFWHPLAHCALHKGHRVGRKYLGPIYKIFKFPAKIDVSIFDKLKPSKFLEKNCFKLLQQRFKDDHLVFALG